MTTLRLAVVWLALFCWPALAHAQTLGGWDNVLAAIDSQPPSKIDELNGREFNLTLSPGARDLSVTPSAPFELTGQGPSYRLRIVNAAALLVDADGLVPKVSVEWKAEIGDPAKFNLAIEGIDECAFNLVFRQKGGDPLNLSAMRARYDVTWKFSRPAAIAASDLNGSSLSIRRVPNDQGPVTVVLRLKQKDGSIDVSSDPIVISQCAAEIKDENGEPGIIQIRTPGQCVVVSNRKEDQFTSGNDHGVNYVTQVRNTCGRPITCEMSFRMFKYNSVADGIARINGTQVAYGKYDVPLPANGVWDYAHFLRAAGGAPYYSWTHPWVPDAAFPDWNEPDLQCRWAA